MNLRNFAFLFAFLPCLASAQGPASQAATDEPNKETRAVLLANRPERFTEEQWLRMMQEPVHRTLFPLRITQAMLDTLDGRKLDLKYQYVLIPNEAQHHGPQIR